ncbi:hypothetical protein B0J17DRAFT_638318 [Rhizoctonia solani]|nr:hypothetical protein B0J17DRAFT_638318 [Rhizoctonia solani]
MPPQTRSKLQIQVFPMGVLSPSAGDGYDESFMLRQKESGDWDERYGAPIRPSVTKRKFSSVSVQTSPIEEICPPLCRDNGSSSGSSPDPESEGEEGYASKHGLKRSGSTTSNQTSKKAKVAKSTVSPSKVVPPKQPRRDTIITLDGSSPKPRSIYAPSPTPLQCTYVYPLALGPPRRPIDLRRNKGAKPLPDSLLAAAGPKPPVDPNAPVPAEGAGAPSESAPMEIDDSHKITHRCPITFSREFEMRRHIRTVHIAEEVRAVVEGRLARSEATVIPENWDGKTLISKPTCAGCGTTFSRPDAVRRHQTEVNAKMENGICIECPGPKVHIRRGPRKDVHLPTPDTSPAPPTLAPAPIPVLVNGVNSPFTSAGIGAGANVPIAPAPAPMALVPAPTLVPAQAPLPSLVPIASTVIPSLPLAAPLAPGAGTSSDAAPAPAAPAVAPQPLSAARDHAEPAEVELESEDECN